MIYRIIIPIDIFSTKILSMSFFIQKEEREGENMETEKTEEQPHESILECIIKCLKIIFE